MDEFSLIAAFTAQLGARAPPRGPGDDCAVLSPSSEALCVTTDAVVEGVHFRRDTFSLEDVGHKALAVNLSDLAAMGARPAWAVCALGLPARVTVAEVRALARGLGGLARAHLVEVVGGNVSRASELSLTLTVGGHLPRGRRPMLRSGGSPGDVLYVSGPLGDAAAGLELLETGTRSGAMGSSDVEAAGRSRLRSGRTGLFDQAEIAHGALPLRSARAKSRPSVHPPDSARGERVALSFAVGPLVAAQRRPAPHLRVGLLAAPFASAAIDVSDGLLQDLGHLCRASGCGAALQSDAVPLSAALRAFAGPARALQLALTGGEDYVLLLAVPARRARAFEAALESAHQRCVRLGLLTRGAALHVDGRPVAVQGFRHFGQSMRSGLRTPNPLTH